MKKINKSLFLLTAVFISAAFFTGCKWNLNQTSYLDRPDIDVEERGFLICGSYVNTDTKYINIYKQDVTDEGNTKIEPVAILFPEGNDDPNDQTFRYRDKNVKATHKYRYYVRFVTSAGEKNRTEWSEIKTATGGADSTASFAYNINGAFYTYDSVNMILEIRDNTKDLTAPSSTIISDIDDYVPALVFQKDDEIQSFAIVSPDTTKSINLKSLLPQNFLYADLTLLGVVGQKTVKKPDSEVLQSITWTDIVSIPVKDTNGIVLSTIKLNPEYGEKGFDYSIKSDNER